MQVVFAHLQLRCPVNSQAARTIFVTDEKMSPGEVPRQKNLAQPFSAPRGARELPPTSSHLRRTANSPGARTAGKRRMDRSYSRFTPEGRRPDLTTGERYPSPGVPKTHRPCASTQNRRFPWKAVEPFYLHRLSRAPVRRSNLRWAIYRFFAFLKVSRELVSSVHLPPALGGEAAGE